MLYQLENKEDDEIVRKDDIKETVYSNLVTSDFSCDNFSRAIQKIKKGLEKRGLLPIEYIKINEGDPMREDDVDG